MRKPGCSFRRQIPPRWPPQSSACSPIPPTRAASPPRAASSCWNASRSPGPAPIWMLCTTALLLYREASFMPKTVLIIDDDAPTRGLLKAVVIRAGLDALVASNGSEAIDIINTRDDLACIVLDLMMPVIDGNAVIGHLSSTSRNVPVIVCTAVGPRQTPDFDRTIVRAVIQKPFDVGQLAAMLKAFSE